MDLIDYSTANNPTILFAIFDYVRITAYILS